MRKNRLYVREFINLPGYNGGAFVLAEVEDTTGEEDCFEPHVRLEIADCDRKVALAFDLYSAEDRANSVRKARLLADVLRRFAEALEVEADLTAEREAERERKRENRTVD